MDIVAAEVVFEVTTDNYTWFDRMVGRWRYREAVAYVDGNSRICDVGCGVDALFLRYLEGRTGYAVGLDYQKVSTGPIKADFVQADVRDGFPLLSESFDCVTMLAVLEHIEQPASLLEESYRILVPGGRLIVTWPGSGVDYVLPLLSWVGVVSPLTETHNHQPRKPVVYWQNLLRDIGFVNVFHRTFELGLNHLMVAYKVSP